MSSFSAGAALAASDTKHDGEQRESLEKVNSHHQCAFLALLEERHAALERSIDQQRINFEMKSERLVWRVKRLNRKAEIMAAREKQLAEDCKEIDATYALVDRCYSIILEKEKDLSWNLADAESTRNQMRSLLKSLEQSERVLESLDEKMIKRSEELDTREEELRVREQSLDDRELELAARETNLKCIERDILENVVDFEVEKEKFRYRHEQMLIRQAELRKDRESVKLRKKKLESRKRDFQEKIQNFDSKKKKFKLDYSFFKEKQRCIDSMLGEIKGDVPTDADIRFYTTMNCKELLQHLIRRVSEQETMGNEVRRALSHSQNPAKLVLDAVHHGFHPQPQPQEQSQESVRKRSCIFLLEQLAELKLEIIHEEEKERARLLALEWKRKMTVGVDCHQDHCLEEFMGFLQLVASYRLVDKFGEDELLKILKVVGSPVLYESLGFKDKVRGRQRYTSNGEST